MGHMKNWDRMKSWYERALERGVIGKVTGVNLSGVAAAATHVSAPELLAAMPEDQWQEKVVALATDNGWKCYHTRDSRGSDEGFFDLVLVRGKYLIFAELKRQDGVQSEAQKQWEQLMTVVAAATGYLVNVYLWRPSDWPAVVAVLTYPAESSPCSSPASET